MKIKSVSAFILYVKDLSRSASFYEELGFKVEKKEAERVVLRINWFWIELRKGKEINNKKIGVLVYVSIDDPDSAYKDLIGKGLKPEEPKDVFENREFLLKDPDGYNLVFFKRR